MKKIILFTLTLLSVLIIPCFADTNGVWHDARDIKPGIMGADEQVGTNLNFTFLNEVFFNNHISVYSSDIDIYSGTIRINGEPVASQTWVSSQGYLKTISWTNISDKPDGFADGIDDSGITNETDPSVLASVKDGVSWAEVTDKPNGFADGVDDGIVLGTTIPAKITCTYTSGGKVKTASFDPVDLVIANNKIVVEYGDQIKGFESCIYFYQYYDGSSTNLGSCLIQNDCVTGP